MRGLGLSYVREFSSKLTTGSRMGPPSSSSSVASSPGAGAGASSASPATDHKPRDELPSAHGEAFLMSQMASYDRALARHVQLIASGERLMEQLGSTRKRLMDQIESECFIRQNFSQLATLRTQLAAIRSLVERIAVDIEDVEVLLVEKTEEYMAAQNASFAARQQQELEVFEAQMLASKEARRRELLEERREKLAEAFRNDLKTYQALVSYQGENASSATKTTDPTATNQVETLESVDLIVTADDSSLQAFYHTDSESEEESDVHAHHPTKESDAANAKVPETHTESETKGFESEESEEHKEASDDDEPESGKSESRAT